MSAGARTVRLLVIDGGGGDGAQIVARLSDVASHRVESAPTLAAALGQLDGPPRVDVVLLDPEAPGLNVPEAFAALHAKAPDVPVVVLTRAGGEHLALAMATVTRSPWAAAAGARRVASLLPTYLGRRERDVETLREAQAQDDYETITRMGHNLRGNGVSFGFPELRAIGERIEAAGRVRDASAVHDAIARLQAYLAVILGRSRPAVRDLVSGTHARAPASERPSEREDAGRRTRG